MIIHNKIIDLILKWPSNLLLSLSTSLVVAYDPADISIELLTGDAVLRLLVEFLHAANIYTLGTTPYAESALLVVSFPVYKVADRIN